MSDLLPGDLRFLRRGLPHPCCINTRGYGASNMRANRLEGAGYLNFCDRIRGVLTWTLTPKGIERVGPAKKSGFPREGGNG